MRFFHFDFLRATACAKVVNFGTNAATLVFLVPAGMVSYELAIPLGVAAIGGSFVGARLAMKGGNQWLRRLFLILAVSLLAKLARKYGCGPNKRADCYACLRDDKAVEDAMTAVKKRREPKPFSGK